MSDQVGKIASGAFRDIILPRLGAERNDIVVGPGEGLDAGIVDLGGGHVLAVTTDPFFVMPELGWERAAWLAVHIVASDAATTGLPPAYCTIDLNLPPAMTDEDLGSLWGHVHQSCRDLGVAVVAGHTGRYDNCAFPMLGGATFLSVGGTGSYVTPAMARPGDAVLLTKGAAIETAGMLGALLPSRIERDLGAGVAHAANSLFWSLSVVEDARVAASVGLRGGGVTAMHDATERGVWNGLCEIARASDVGMVADQQAIPLLDEVQAICQCYGIDPYTASSEGTLLVTCRPEALARLAAEFDTAGIKIARIGEITPAGEGVRVVRDGLEYALEAPESDPFWPALMRLMEEEH